MKLLEDRYFLAFAGFLILFLVVYPNLYEWYAVPALKGQCQELIDQVKNGSVFVAPENCSNPTVRFSCGVINYSWFDRQSPLNVS